MKEPITLDERLSPYLISTRGHVVMPRALVGEISAALAAASRRSDDSARIALETRAYWPTLLDNSTGDALCVELDKLSRAQYAVRVYERRDLPTQAMTPEQRIAALERRLLRLEREEGELEKALQVPDAKGPSA